MHIKEIQIRPYEGVDILMEDGSVKELRFGMTREEVRGLFDEKPETFLKSKADKLLTDSFLRSSLFAYYKDSDVVEALEFSDFSGLYFQAIDLLKEPYHRLLQSFLKIDPKLIVTPANGLRSLEYGISLWAPYAEEEGPEYVPESVLVFNRNNDEK